MFITLFFITYANPIRQPNEGSSTSANQLPLCCARVAELGIGHGRRYEIGTVTKVVVVFVALVMLMAVVAQA